MSLNTEFTERLELQQHRCENVKYRVGTLTVVETYEYRSGIRI